MVAAKSVASPRTCQITAAAGTATAARLTKLARRVVVNAKYATRATASATQPPRDSVKKNVNTSGTPAAAARTRHAGWAARSPASARATTSPSTITSARTFQ